MTTALSNKKVVALTIVPARSLTEKTWLHLQKGLQLEQEYYQ